LYNRFPTLKSNKHKPFSNPSKTLKKKKNKSITLQQEKWLTSFVYFKHNQQKPRHQSQPATKED